MNLRNLVRATVAILTLAVSPVRAEGSRAGETLEAKLDTLIGRPHGLTADKVAERAVATSFDVRSRQEEVAAAGADVDRAVINFAPRLTGQASYTKLSAIPATQLGTLRLDSPTEQKVFEQKLTVPLLDYVLRLPSEHRAAQRQRDGGSPSPGGRRCSRPGPASPAFGDLAVVLGLSVFSIFLALVIQFKSAVKPMVVFAAIPFGVVAALLSLSVMGAPFGFMAFLGIISLIGVIVSHIIVLFDFIEEAHERGEDLREALLDAGLARLRPVLITVGATVLGLIPLALHGGPLWEPLCYAQIGGLTFATFLTLLLVPVLYTIFVRDLGWIRWEKPVHEEVEIAEELLPEAAA